MRVRIKRTAEFAIVIDGDGARRCCIRGELLEPECYTVTYVTGQDDGAWSGGVSEWWKAQAA